MYGAATAVDVVSGKSLQAHVLNLDTEAACPNCAYPVWIRLVEVAAKASVLCPACRTRIWLVDPDASVHNAPIEVQRVIDEAMDDLTSALRKAFR